MAKNKTYFQSLGQLSNNPKFDEIKEKEFVDELPTDVFFEQ